MKHPIPREALDDRLGFIGTSGSGKTYNAGTAIEVLLALHKARVVIIDPLGVWWGLRLLADGKKPSGFNVVIFGGDHADLPLNEQAGALIGETAATMAESCIIDLSKMPSRSAERRFMVAFLETIYRKAGGEPFHLIVDEADLFAPQKPQTGDEVLLGHMENIVRRGRVRGFIPWLISQRPAVLNKNVLSQVDGLLAFKLTASQDRDALDAWIEGQADKAQGKAIKAALPTFRVGEGIVWLPSHGMLERRPFPPKVTFDSSRKPKRGEKLQSKKLKPIDVGKLKDQIASVVEEAKANDPKALRKELADLKTQIAKVGIAKPAIPDKSAIAAAEQRGFDQAKKKLTTEMEREVQKRTAEVLAGLSEKLVPLMTYLGEQTKAAKVQRPSLSVIEYARVSGPPVLLPQLSRPPALPRQPHPATNGHAPDDGTTLPKGERRCLTAIAQNANSIMRQHLTVITGYKRSTRDAYIQRLREKEFVGEQAGRLHLTDDGLKALGPFDPLPTGEALQQHVLSTLPEGERAVLSFIIGSYPQAVDRDAISEATGYKRSTRDAYIQRLSTRELIDASRGPVIASEDLFA